MGQGGGVLDAVRRRRAQQRAGAVVAGAVVAVVLGAVLATGGLGRLAGPGPCGDRELLSAGEVEDLLGAPVRTTERLAGNGCTYRLDSGEELRVHAPTAYSDRDEAGLRALDLAALAAGRATAGTPDGGGRASYAATSRGETVTAAYGEMVMVLALRWSPAADPGATRSGLVRVAAGLIEQLTPARGRGFTAHPDDDRASPSRDLCPDVVTVAQLEERTGLLVTESRRNGVTSCSFSVDEPGTIDIGVRVTDESGQRSAADAAALRQVDLAAAPVANLDGTADEDWPQGGATYTVRSTGTGPPDSYDLKAQAGTTRVEVWYLLRDPDQGAGAVGEVRPGLLRLAGQVTANL